MAVTAPPGCSPQVTFVSSAFANPPSLDAGSGTKTILVVDDIWIARRTAARYLSSAGYRVYEAASAEEAFEVVRRLAGHVDLVLTDVVMPDFSGVEFGRQLTQQWPAILVLFMSAYSALMLEQYGMDLTQPLVEKPFTEEGLIYKVAELLDRDRHVSAEPGRPPTP